MLSEETRWGLRLAVWPILFVLLLSALTTMGFEAAGEIFPFIMVGYVFALLAYMLYSVRSYEPPYGVKAYLVTGGVFTGGSIWFGTHASWPFGRLCATADEITVVAPWRRYAFRRGEFAISRYGVLLKNGIRFEHKNPGYPAIVAFVPKISLFGLLAFEKELKALGYAIKE